MSRGDAPWGADEAAAGGAEGAEGAEAAAGAEGMGIWGPKVLTQR